jgi:hypothetical protein
MSISQVTLTHEPDDEVVAQSPPADVEPPPDPRGGAERHAGAVAVADAARPPADREIASIGVSPAGARTRAKPQRFEDLRFLESARMDREMARELNRSVRSQRTGMSITAALMDMSVGRFRILAAGVLLLTVGLLALRLPVFLSDFDQWGFQINCGSGFQGSFTQAGVAEMAGTHFVDHCRAAVATRRAWAIPLTAGGALLIGGLLVMPPKRQRGMATEIDLLTV